MPGCEIGPLQKCQKEVVFVGVALWRHRAKIFYTKICYHIIGPMAHVSYFIFFSAHLLRYNIVSTRVADGVFYALLCPHLNSTYWRPLNNFWFVTRHWCFANIYCFIPIPKWILCNALYQHHSVISVGACVSPLGLVRASPTFDERRWPA